MAGAYGERMGEICGVRQASAILSRNLRRPAMVITEIRSDAPSPERSLVPEQEDAFVVATSLVDGLRREGWVDNRPLSAEPPHPAGTVTFLDFRRLNQVRFFSPIHSIQFYFPLGAVRGVFGNSDLTGLNELSNKIGRGLRDDTVYQLAQSVQPAFVEPAAVSPVFLDHILLAVMAHVLVAHGGAPPSPPNRGGLAPWQLRRATELMDADLAGPSLVELAEQCRLSARHFARAFKQSTGLPPHRWLLARRVERAKALLERTTMPLTEIASVTSFASQAHFTRVFSAQVGVSPGAWRRAVL